MECNILKYLNKGIDKMAFLLLIPLFSSGVNAQQDTAAINKTIRQFEHRVELLTPSGKNFEIISAYKILLSDKADYLKRHYPEKLAHYYLELSFYYSEVNNQKYEIEYTQKAIELMTSAKKYSLPNYLTAYNNWYYFASSYGDAKESARIFWKYECFYKNLTSNTFGIEPSDLSYARNIYDKMQILEELNANRFEEAHSKLQEFYCRIRKDKSADTSQDISYYMSCYDAFTYKYYENQDYRNATKYLEELQRQSKLFNQPFYRMKANALLGSIGYQTKEYDKGIAYCNAALRNFEFAPFSSSRYSIETIKALNLSGKGRNDEATKIAGRIVSEIARQYFQEDILLNDIDAKNFDELNSYQYINIFASLALVFKHNYQDLYKTEDLAKAEKLATVASRMFQEFYKKGEYNTTLSQLQNKIAETLLFICCQKETSKDKKIQLLNAIERNKSQHLFKEVQKKILLKNSRLAQLYNELELLQNEKKYYEGLAEGDSTNQTTKIATLEQKIRLAKKELKLKFPNFIQVDVDFELAEIQKNLAENETIWRFYVADENVYGMKVTRYKLQIYYLQPVGEATRLVLHFAQQVKRPNTPTAENAKEINSKLFPKVIPKEQLTVISDNFLNYLPFEAVFFESDGSFPVISYYYSFPMWLLSKKTEKSHKAVKLASFSPHYGDNFWFDNREVTPLPYARQESQVVSSLFEGARFHGEKATKESFLNSGSDFTVYHFAMHAFLSENDFAKSCLLFSNNQPLYFDELYEHYIPADLVTLSACDTGNGKLAKGEGIMSIARAFAFAGVKSAVVSLWQVPDKETSEIMILFYKNLKKGLPKDKALTMAKQEFIRQNPLKNHPYFWAGFILNGDTSPVCKSAVAGWIWVISGLVIGLIVFLWFYKKFYSKS